MEETTDGKLGARGASPCESLEPGPYPYSQLLLLCVEVLVPAVTVTLAPYFSDTLQFLSVFSAT